MSSDALGITGNIYGSLCNAASAPSGEEQAVFEAKLLRLLAKRIQRYTGGESSSLPEETAAELLASVRYLLSRARREDALDDRALAAADLDALFARGLSLLEGDIERCRGLWELACRTSPQVENTSYGDTLRSIGQGFFHYDHRYFAHSFPCDIDYQLCAAVPEALSGMDYIAEYLRRIIIENRLLARFGSDTVAGLLEVYCPDYREQLINLYEPVLTNALGLALLNCPPLPLCVPAETLGRLEAELTLPAAELRVRLEGAAKRLCAGLRLTEAQDLRYAADAALALTARIKSALPHGGLGGIFLSF